MNEAGRGGKKQPRHLQRVEEARREVEARVDDLRTALDRELKWLPRGRSWTLPLVGLAVGVVLALGRTRGRDSRRASDGSDAEA
ncbi:MAG: hypothetical protein MPN21_06500 [Thermoanaerobaculia bacterium]|nr:hypothetical protein [Thermoanaerobaculia bacterium]